MPLRRQADYLVLSMLLTLSACGDGGSAGSGGTVETAPPPPVVVQPPPPPPPAPTATIVLAEPDTFRLPDETLSASSAVMVAAQYAIEAAQRFKTRGAALSQTIACYNNGELIVTLTDADGDGIASAGDRLSVQGNSCAKDDLGNYTINGRLTIDLQAGTLLAEDKLNAVVQVEDGTDVAQMLPQIGGSFVLGWERTAFAQSWKVNASSKDDLKLLSTYFHESAFLRAPSIVKTVDAVTGDSKVSLAMRYENGADIALVSTPMPIATSLNHGPQPGSSVEVKGANGVIRVTTDNSEGYPLAISDLLLGTSSTPAATSKYAWQGFTGVALWWDGQCPAAQFVSLATADFGWKLYISDPASLNSPDAVFHLQFNRPPVALPQLYYRFVDVTSSMPFEHNPPPTLPNVSATAEPHGALLLIRPAQALAPGHAWNFEASLDGVTWPSDNPNAPDIVLSDAEGHQTRLTNGVIVGWGF